MATTTGKSYIPIKSEELMAHLAWANPRMMGLDYRPTRRLRLGEKGSVLEPISSDLQTTEKISLLGLANEISGGSPLLTLEATKVMTAIRDGVCLGLHVSKAYTKRSGFDTLQQQNATANLSPAQSAEFNAKAAVTSAIAVFVASSYVVHELSRFEESDVSATKVSFSGVPEINYRSPVISLSCLLFHFGKYCTKEAGVVQNSLELVKLAILYFEAVANEIHDKEKSFAYAEPFTEVGYRLEGSEFTVEGFKVIKHTASVSAEFRKIKFDEIVGNQRAKHMSIRTVMTVCCYDFEREKNPFLELGSFPLVEMGEGKAGTGKSMIIAAKATLFQEVCDKLGIPFHFCPIPATIVSTFQGGSAERMEDWMGHLADSKRIVYAPMDDCENLMMDRTREGVSAGVREAISVFLRNTEGASAIVRGNAVIDLLTNLPELLDRAVLSRIQRRSPIDGAKTWEDYVDQTYLWLRKLTKLDPGFVKLGNKSGYEFLSAQKALKNLSQLQADNGAYAIKDPKVQEAVEIARKAYPTSDQGFFAEVFMQVGKRFPHFSSRDVRNIHSAVDSRIIDFDLPHEWLDDPKLFYKQSYETKVEMLREELRKNTKGLNLEEIFAEEAFRYLDSMAKIAFVEYERDVEAYLKKLRVMKEGERRFKLEGQALAA